MRIHTKFRRPSFTLIEMTIVIAIIGILAAMAMSVYATALSQSKVHRTRAMIAKIDQLIGEKYESYRTRPVPIRILPGLDPSQTAWIRLCAMRDLMRMEMPDHREDVIDGPATLPSGYTLVRPALSRSYLRRAGPSYVTYPGDWSNDSAECLYLILANMRDGDKNSLDYFSPSEIGDLDGDGLNEIHDAWGQPIVWFRWAPGYFGGPTSPIVSPQDVNEPDPFDPYKRDPRWTNGSAVVPFALKPLIVSGGPDKRIDLFLKVNFRYSLTSGIPGSPCNSDPYVLATDVNNVPTLFGSPYDLNADGSPDYPDNITNHDLEAR